MDEFADALRALGILFFYLLGISLFFWLFLFPSEFKFNCKEVTAKKKAEEEKREDTKTIEWMKK